jgi:hypothetical protein
MILAFWAGWDILHCALGGCGAERRGQYDIRGATVTLDSKVRMISCWPALFPGAWTGSGKKE